MVYLVNNNFCQSWQDYSDSSIKYTSIDLNKSEEFINISSRLIRNKDKKSTIDYVKYLYRYGAVKLLRSENVAAEKYLKEAQSRLLEINHKEHFQSAQINFALAKSQLNQHLEISSISNFKKTIIDLNKSEIKNEYFMQNSTKILSDLYSNLGNCDSILKYSELALDHQIKKRDTSSLHNLGLYNLYSRIIYCGKDLNKLEQAEYSFNAAMCLAKTSYRDSLIFFRNIYFSADLYKDLQKYEKSKEIYDYANSITTNKESINYSLILTGLEWLHRQQEDYSSAINYINDKLKIYINHYGENNKNTIETYASLALCYGLLDDNLKSAEYYSKAIELAKSNGDFPNEKIAEYYSFLSNCYDSHALNNNLKANEYLNLSKKYGAEIKIKDGDYYYEQFDIFLENEEYDKAKENFLLAELKYLEEKNFKWLFYLYFAAMDLCWQSRIFEPDQITDFNLKIQGLKNKLDPSILYLTILSDSFYAFSQNNFKEVESLLSSNLNSFKEEDEYSFLKARSTLALSKNILGKVDEAIKLIDFCIDYKKQKSGENSPELLELYGNAATIAVTNKPEIAMKYITPASMILKSQNMENTLAFADLMFKKGSALLNQLNEDGLDFLISGAEIYHQYQNYPNYMNFIVYNNLIAYHLILNGDYLNAEDYINESEKTLNNYNPNNYSLLAEINIAKGNLYFYQDKFEEAINFYLKAKKNLGNDNLQDFSYLIDLNYGMSLWLSGLNKELAKSLLENLLTAKISPIIRTNTNLSLYKIYFTEGNKKKSKDYLITILEDLKNQIDIIYKFVSDNEKQNILKEAGLNFEWLNTHLLFDYADAEFLKKYMDYRSFYRSILLSKSNKRLNSTIKKGQNYDLQSKLEKLKNNTALINRIYEDFNMAEERLEELLKENEELERVLTYELDKLGLKETPISYDNITSNLSDNESFVEIVRINKQPEDITYPFTDTIYYAAIILEKGKDPELILLDTNNKFENEFITNYNSHLKGSNNNKVDEFSYDFYLSKIIDEVGKDKTIYISPDGVYNNINLNTLYDKSSQSYTISNTDLRIVSGARNFVKNKTDKKENYTFKNATIIGNPIFDLGDVYYTFNNEDQSLKRDFNMDDFDNLSRSGIRQLPGTKKEISSIYNLLSQHDWEVDLYEQSNATENQLKNVDSPRILHLATHGFFFPKKNTYNSGFMNLLGSSISIFDSPLRRSGVLLSGAQNTLRGERIGKENGVLTSFEARELDLSNTELVVLSACETGVGEYVSGEGVYGLQRSILEAGSENIIMSLWKVDDEATRILMTTFYLNWIEKGMTIRESLKQAQISLMQNPKYKSPYYWGAFVLIGT